MFDRLSNHICDKYYYVETKNHGVFNGYMLNYNGGNIVILSKKGIIHMPYSEIVILKPLSKAPNEELENMIKDINDNKY